MLNVLVDLVIFIFGTDDRRGQDFLDCLNLSDRISDCKYI